MTRTWWLTLLALAASACGVNLGAPPRRVFPNPPSTRGLERTPIVDAPAPVTARCELPGAGLATIDVAAPGPWGVRLRGSDVEGVLPANPMITTTLVARTRAALATCPVTGNDAAVTSRVVIERVEVNDYEGAGGYEVARVVLRLERFTPAFDRFESWRAEGSVRVRHGASVAALVEAAHADALATLLAREARR